MSQGVWVYASSIGSMTFSQTDKSNSDATFIRNHNQDPLDFRIILSENTSTYSCTMSIEEKQNMIDGHDLEGDVMHLSTGNEKSSSIAFDFGEDILVRKNYISTEVNDKSFPLYLNILREGYHTLTSANSYYGLNNYNKVLIYDSVTDEFFDMRKEENYVFYADEGESNRFRLILSNSEEMQTAGIESTTEINDKLSIIQMGNMLDLSLSGDHSIENAKISLINALGQQEVLKLSQDLTLGSNMITLPENLKGFYIVTVIAEGKRVSKKLVF